MSLLRLVATCGRVAALALALLGGVPARAQADCPPPTPELDAAAWRAAAQDPPDRGLLWQFEKHGRVGWLYGTVHVGQPAWLFPGPQVAAALGGAQRLLLELDPLDPALQRRLQQLGARDPSDPPLPDALARRLVAQGRVACAGASLDGLRPELQALTLVALSARRLGLDPAFGVDLGLAAAARQRGLPVSSLETPEEQLRALLADDEADRASRLSQWLDDLEDPAALGVLRRLADDWAGSRLDDLSDHALWCHCLETPAQRALQAQLVDRRNAVMARRIVERHAQGERLFVAVGALHLTGPQGLPALLAQQGFVLTRRLPAP